MQDYAKEIHNYILQLKQICFQKNFKQEIFEILKDWLCKLTLFYNAELDILNKKSLKEYINDYLKSLEKVESITIYNLEDILKDKDNYFYSRILKMSYSTDKNKIKYRFKKEDNNYVIDSKGDYYLAAVGACFSLENRIELINDKEIIENIHHELTHIKQDLFGYFYPSFFPFSFNIRKMLREGNATFHEKIYYGDINPKVYKWHYLNIQNNQYEYYYQLYMLLMLILPKKLTNSWEKGEFNITLLDNNQIDRFTFIFALITILLNDSTNEVLEESVNYSYNYCQNKLNKTSDNNLYQFSLLVNLKIQDILKKNLNNSELFKILIKNLTEILIKKVDVNGLLFIQTMNSNKTKSL